MSRANAATQTIAPTDGRVARSRSRKVNVWKNVARQKFVQP